MNRQQRLLQFFDEDTDLNSSAEYPASMRADFVFGVGEMSDNRFPQVVEFEV